MEELIENMKKAIVGDTWVLFSNGTFILFDKDEAPNIGNLEEEATNLLKEYGPVYAGCPAGDFNVHPLKISDLGWLVSGHCPKMYTYVNPSEVNENANEIQIGFFGRNKRNLDSQEQKIIYTNKNF